MRHHHHQTPVLSQRVRRAGRDPFLARIGLMLVGCALLAPLAMVLRTSDGGGVESSGLPGAAAVLEVGAAPSEPTAVAGGALIPPDQAAAIAAAQPTAAPSSLVSQTVAPAPTPAPIAPAQAALVAPVASPAPTPAPTAAAVPAPAAPESTAPLASVAAVTESVATVPATVAVNPNCRDPYSVAAGDYWTGIAKRHQITLQELLDNNGAGPTTAIYPGDVICLPKNAVKPTAAPSSSAAPATTKPQSAPPTTKPAPATTKPAPATTKPAPPANNYSDEQVKDIIRAVWPDDLEDKALQIAGRESGYDPTAKNYCCYGVFQLYWDVHKSWMKAAGISSAQELYNPEVNAYAAYLLYQRSGGWGPWSQTNGP
jgi:LysM repeat protein